MVEATSTLFLLPAYSIFLVGICLLVLSSLLSIAAPNTRNKLHLNWLIPGTFTLGLSRILMAFEALEPIKFYFLIEALLKIFSMLFLAEFIRKNWPTSEEQKLSAFMHIPLAAFFIILYAISSGEASPLLKIIFGLIKLLTCFIGLKAAHDLPQENQNCVKAIFWPVTIVVVLQTFIHLALYSKFASFTNAENKNILLVFTYAELALLLTSCSAMLAGRYFYERNQKLQAQNTFSLLLPAVIFMTTIFLSATGIKLGQHVADQQNTQTATVLEKTIFSMTQLVNQRIVFASTSSGIMAASPIMAQYFENPDQQNSELLNNFLKSFTASNPGAICYVMDTTGKVHAASDLESLFVGKDLGFRSYFKLAMNDLQGNLIDYGVLTNTLGYYSSNPIKRASDHKIVGVCAVKRNLDDVENMLKLYHPTMLLDSSGTIFLASEKRLAGIKLQLPPIKSRNAQLLTQLKNYSLLGFEISSYYFATLALENQDWQMLMLMPAYSPYNQRWVLIIILLMVFVFIAILSGITRNTESLKSIEIARNQFKLVYDNAPESIFVVSLKSLKIIEANQSTLRQFNFSHTTIGLSYFDLMPASRHKISNAWHNIADKIFKHQRDFKKQNGEMFSAEVTGSIIEFNNEKALLLILHDISLHKAIEDKLIEAKNAAEEANALKVRFFANASHEIRTPMTAIIGLTELAASLCSSAEQRHILDLVRTSGKSMLNLLNDILDLAQIEAGRLKINPVQFNLQLLLKDLLEIIRFQADSSAVKTSLNISRDLPEIIISDPDRIRQILLNLLTNAVKFTRRGEIKLSASISQSNQDSSMIDFAVSDTRNGLSTEIQHNLFGAFVYTDPYVMDEAKSGSLGLSISKQIVDLMGGKISVATEPGDGTTFRVSIPVIIGEFAPVIAKQNEIFRTSLKTGGRPLHFLIADDNEINLFLAGSIIEKFKGTSHCVKDGIEVINSLQTHDFDAVLLDIQMPRLDGIATIKAIRQLAGPIASIPVIAISAFASDHEKQMAKEAGAQYYLAKPYFPEDLLSALKEVLQLDQEKITNGNADESADQNHEKQNHNLGNLLQINRNELELRILKKPENILQINEIFVRRSETLEKELNDCVQEKNAERLREAAHAIKGLTGMLAANSVLEVARDIEYFCRDGELAKAADLVPELKEKLHEIAADLAVLKAEAEKKLA